MVQLGINGMQLPFEVDTGAAVSLISLDTKKKFFKEVRKATRYISIITYLYFRVHTCGWNNASAK